MALNKFKKGTILFNPGDPSNNLYIIHKGKVISEFQDTEDEDYYTKIRTFTPGSILGYEGYISHSKKCLSRVRFTEDVSYIIRDFCIEWMLYYTEWFNKKVDVWNQQPTLVRNENSKLGISIYQRPKMSARVLNVW